MKNHATAFLKIREILSKLNYIDSIYMRVSKHKTKKTGFVSLHPTKLHTA